MQKKFTISVIAFLALLLLALDYSNLIKVLVNGTEINPQVNAKIINGRVYVPLSLLADKLDLNVGWNQTKREFYINSPQQVWQQNLSRKDNYLSDIEWINARNLITKFLIAFDNRDQNGKVLVSKDFNTNLLGSEVIIPFGGVYPAMIDYKFIDVKFEQNRDLHVLLKVYEKSPEGQTIVRDWNFYIKDNLIRAIYVSSRIVLKEHAVFSDLILSIPRKIQ